VKHTLFAFGLASALLFGVPAQAGFNEGMAAYKSGNYAVAFKEFDAAARAGDKFAQVMAATMCLEGSGVTRDVKQAAYWFEKAAGAGHSYAQYAIGMLYMAGDGVSKDTRKGLVWLKASADQGSFFAQTTLGDAYANGIGVTPDKARALDYYRQAANQNYAVAQLKLASAHYLGDGLPKDAVEAYKWTYLSSSQLDGARTLLGKLRQELTPAQVAEGERAARAWQSQSAQR